MKRCNILLGTLLTMCTFCTLSVKAQEPTYFIVVHASGEQSFELDDLTKITFENGKMQAVSTAATVNYDLESLNKLVFGTTSTSIDSQVDVDKTITYNKQAETITITGARGSKVQLFHISGNLIETRAISGDKESVSLSGYSKGIYLVRVNNQVIKIRK